MKIHACLNVFNEAQNLQKTVESIVSFVDHIIIVDGAYRDFPYQGNKGASDDGTLGIALQMMDGGWPVTIIPSPDAGWKDEMAKRTAYMDAVPVGDWVFIIDGDELLAAGGNFLRNLASYEEMHAFDAGVVQERFEAGHYGTTTRLYKKKPGMKYDQGHAHVVYDVGYRYRELFMPIVLEEHHEARPEARNAQRLEYYKSGKMR